MARVILPSDLQQVVGVRDVDVKATDFRALVAELCERYPTLSEEKLRQYAVGIDGMIVQKPLLEQFQRDSELVFMRRIAGG